MDETTEEAGADEPGAETVGFVPGVISLWLTGQTVVETGTMTVVRAVE